MGEARWQTKRGGSRTDPVPLARIAPATKVAWRAQLLGGVLLLLAGAITFSPAFHAEFLQWDDQVYVARNELLRDAAGLAEIWSPRTNRLPAYYPVVFSSYWLEYRVWGPNPRPYHRTNVLLHLANSVLALLLARRLGASPPAALATAAVFAIHPVQAQSVAWIAERKNVLCGFFYFITFLLYLRSREEKGSRLAYVLCLASYTAALLSKTQTVTLPLAIVLYEILAGRSEGSRPGVALRSTLTRVTPMLALGLAAGLVTTQFEHRLVQPWYEIPSAAERPLVAARAAWFYIGKFLLPVDLAPLYPKWAVATPASWAALLTWPLALALVVRWRRSIPALTLWGAAQFLFSLAPALGLLSFSWQHFSYVGNHLLYLSCFGGGLAAAVLVESLAKRSTWRFAPNACTALGLLILTGLAVQAYRETLYWQDDLKLATRAVERNPHSWITNLQLGRRLREKGRFGEALDSLERALALARASGRSEQVLQDYFRALEGAKGPQAVIQAAGEEIERDPTAYVAHLYRGLILERLGRTNDARADFRRVMQLAERGSVAWQMADSARRRLDNKAR